MTVGGESAGGMSVLAHLASPLAKGLFDRAIVESGTIALPYNQLTGPNTFYSELMEAVGCPQSKEDYAGCLRALPAEAFSVHAVHPRSGRSPGRAVQEGLRRVPRSLGDSTRSLRTRGCLSPLANTLASSSAGLLVSLRTGGQGRRAPCGIAHP